MPLNLADLRAKRRTVAVEWEGETINVEYRPQAVNPAFESSLRNLVQNSSGKTEAEQWAVVLGAVSGWDLVDGKKPLPVSTEVLSELPSSLLQKILVDILADARPKAPTAALSAAG